MDTYKELPKLNIDIKNLNIKDYIRPLSKETKLTQEYSIIPIKARQ